MITLQYRVVTLGYFIIIGSVGAIAGFRGRQSRSQPCPALDRRREIPCSNATPPNSSSWPTAPWPLGGDRRGLPSRPPDDRRPFEKEDHDNGRGVQISICFSRELPYRPNFRPLSPSIREGTRVGDVGLRDLSAGIGRQPGTHPNRLFGMSAITHHPGTSHIG